MNTTEMIEKIAEKDFDVNEFVQIAIHEKDMRNEIVYQMLTNSDIMVYYHCYYVADKASQKHPELFYPYWGKLAHLLHHENSYHRDFALEIIGNLTKVDHEDRFVEIADVYFGLIHDEKFMTGNCCVKNMLKIYRHKPQQRIMDALLDIEHYCDYTAKQKAVLKADVLEIFDEVVEDTSRRDEIYQFIQAQVHSISPKTRKKAKELVRKYSL